MTKEQVAALLTSIGAKSDEETAGKVLDAFNADITGNFIPKGKFDELNQELKSAKAAQASAEAQVKELGSFKGSNDELKAKVAELEKAQDDIKAKAEAELSAFKKTTSLRESLLRDGCLNPDLAIKAFDIDTVNFDSKGKPSAETAKEYAQFKAANPYLFKAVPTTPNADFFKGNEPESGEDAGTGNTAKSLTGDATADAIVKAAIDKGTSASKGGEFSPDYYFKAK